MLKYIYTHTVENYNLLRMSQYLLRATLGKYATFELSTRDIFSRMNRDC